VNDRDKMNHHLTKSARGVQEVLNRAGLDCKVVELPSSTKTATDAAKSIGCTVSQIVKSLIFRTKVTTRPVLILASGSNRVSEQHIELHIGEEITKADPEFIRKITGFAIGGIPPLGHTQTIDLVFMDEDLLNLDEVWAAAGTPNAVFCIKSKDLMNVTHSKVISLSKLGASTVTRKIFWQDPYLTELETTVKTVHGNQITLAETIFYAFSGGQESDAGTIGGYQVLKAQKGGREIYYTLPDDHKLTVGKVVKVVIDWHRRYMLMRLHFAAEVVLELVCQKFPNITKVGAHISQDKARIDFEWGQNITPFIQSLEQESQKIIDANQEIISAYSDEPLERRYWKINEFSPVPCGGTHIKTTGEIGVIKLKRINPGKGKERIDIFIHTKA